MSKRLVTAVLAGALAFSVAAPAQAASLIRCGPTGCTITTYPAHISPRHGHGHTR